MASLITMFSVVQISPTLTDTNIIPCSSPYNFHNTKINLLENILARYLRRNNAEKVLFNLILMYYDLLPINWPYYANFMIGIGVADLSLDKRVLQDALRKKP
jgi:hypothetical protein